MRAVLFSAEFIKKGVFSKKMLRLQQLIRLSAPDKPAEDDKEGDGFGDKGKGPGDGIGEKQALQRVEPGSRKMV